MSKVEGQDKLIADISKIFSIFKNSNGTIRPHFFLAGPSGTGKTFTISTIAKNHNIPFVEINAAQLTKEGMSGNSLSKALSPLGNMNDRPCVCFCDEFDKLFISGNTNDSLAHESTNGVQNEFLKVLESDTASVYGDYGRYININVKNTLFIFAGAFNGVRNINIDTLKSFGVKTEFLGRVGLIYNTAPLSLDTMYKILESSVLLKDYLQSSSGLDKTLIIDDIKRIIKEDFEYNMLGARMIHTIIHKYFIEERYKLISQQI